jgi:hypothetical protein
MSSRSARGDTQPYYDLFEISDVHEWYRNHHTFVFLQSQHDDSLMSHKLISSPTTGSPLQLSMAVLPSPIWKGTLVQLNYHTYFKEQSGNLYG